jgi:glycosidase
MDANFKTVDWAYTSSIYEVNIRQYTVEGTFKAFEQHIPRLKDMGVDILWLMPITPISQEGKKGSLGSYYACSSYTKINPEFGKEADLISLIKTAHSLDMKVIIDWVANHTGRYHEWMEHHPDWFSQDAAGNFTERNGWEDVVDLNFNNKAMRAALQNAMHYWVNTFDIDGFRCDMAHLVPLDFWKDVRVSFKDAKPLFWLAECEVRDYHQVFDATYAWHWMHVSEKLARNEAGVHDIYNVLHDYAGYPEGTIKLLYTSNHDENSWNGTEFEKYGPAAKPWAVFAHTWKGMPLLYSGQELPNKKRLQFFDKDSIVWESAPVLHDFYKTLLHLRKQYPVLIHGETFNLPSSDHNVMVYIRHHQDQVVLVVLNVSTEHCTIQCNHELLHGTFKQIFSGMEYKMEGYNQFELMPGDYFVYVKS